MIKPNEINKIIAQGIIRELNDQIKKRQHKLSHVWDHTTSNKTFVRLREATDEAKELLNEIRYLLDEIRKYDDSQN